MPQFDFYSFSGQTFWLLLTFSAFYFFILYFYLSNFSELLKMRSKIINFYLSQQKITDSKALNLYNFFFLNFF